MREEEESQRIYASEASIYERPSDSSSDRMIHLRPKKNNNEPPK